MTKTLILVGFAFLALSVAGCAPARTDAVRAQPAPLPTGGSAGGGVIVSIRPMHAAASAMILAALNEASAARGTLPATAVEFIIREDGGRAISVVQSDAGGFRPGERVVLISGARTGLAPART